MNDDFENQYAAQFAGTTRANTGITGGISTPISGTKTAPVIYDPSKPTVTGTGFLDKVAAVGKQSASIGLQVAEAGAKYVGNTAVDIGKSALHTGQTLVDLATQPIQLSMAQKTIAGLDQYQKDLDTKYRASKISKDDYNAGLEHLGQARKEINDKLLEPISDGPTAVERNKDILETTVNLLSLGRWSAVKAVGTEGARTILGKTVDTAITKIQGVLLKVPAAKELIAQNAAAVATREAQQVAGESLEQYVAREGKRVAVALLIKRPLFYQQNIQDATNIYTSMMKGDYGAALKSTGWLASQMVGGGPMGWFLKQGKNLGVKLRQLSYGKQSLIDALSAEIGDKNPAQAARYLRTLAQKSPDTFQKHEEIARIMQETNLRVSNERINVAVQNILSTYDQAGVARENINFGMILQDYEKWHQAALITDGLKGKTIQGLTPEQVNNLVVVRWDSVMKRGFAEALRQAGNDKQAMVAVLNDFSNRAGVGWGNNPNLVKQLTRIIDDSSSAEQAAKRVVSIPTATIMPEGLSTRVQKQLADLGYGVAVPMSGVRKTPIVTAEQTRKLVTSAVNGPRVVTDRQMADIPHNLKEPYSAAKGFDNVEDFIGHLKKQVVTRTEQVTKSVSEVQNTPPLKHFTTEQIAEKLSKGSKFDHSHAPLHGTGGKEYGAKTGRFVSDGKPAMYLSLDDKKWDTAHVPTNNPEFVDISKMSLAELKAFEKAGGSASFDYDKQTWVGVKNGYSKVALKGVNYYTDSNARVLTIDSVDKLKAVMKEVGESHDSPKFWSKLRSKYDVVNILNTDKNASTDGLGRWFKAAKGDQSIVLNTDKVSLKPFTDSKEITESVSKTKSKDFDEKSARDAFELAHQKPVTVSRTFDDSAIFDEATAPAPVLNAIAGALDKSGLSPIAVNRVANDSLRQSLAAGLSDTEIGQALGMTMDGDTAKGGAAVLSQLQRYVDNKKPVLGLGKISSGKSAVTDIRMLTTREIGEALGISAKDAKQVQGAILDAYTKVPLGLRGLGDRAVDLAYKYNPAQKYYARIQSALRYTYNPFFRVQEQVETAALSKMNANKFIWLKSKEELNGAAQRLSDTGFFEGNLNSAAAEDVVFGRISANLTGFQKRNLAGLAMTIAERKGLSLDDMITKYPDEIEDALRVIVQYPNKGILASSMARTLNIAFFPMRYNAKLTMLAAQKIAELPPSLQLATIQGFLKMKDWMQSDEGIRWQSTHADAIQVFKWITPVGSIQQFYKVVTGNIESPADLGLLGGLPFGMISQMLDSQGVIRLNTPYVNPTTGDVLPSYIPQTTRARAATALQDLLGTMFSFPGRTLGLPGKGDTLRKAVSVFIDNNGSDFEKRIETNRLTPLQQKMVTVLKGDTSRQAVDSLYTSPAPGQFNYYTLPPFEVPIKAPTTAQTPLQERTGLPTRQPKTKKLPQPIPQR